MLFLQDWNYKMQSKLHNVHIRDIPKGTKSDIYDETIIYVILIHGAVEDCYLRKAYKAPFLIPITCHQVKKYRFMSPGQRIKCLTSINVEKLSFSQLSMLSLFHTTP